MKNLISLLTCVLILAVPTARPQTSNTAPWRMYTVKDERFSIDLPVLPVMDVTTDTRARPQKDRQRRVIKCSSEGIVYTILIIENPKPRLTLESFIQEQATANPGDKLTSAGDSKRDGVAAKEFVYADGKGMIQFFTKNDRLYDVRAYGAPADDPRIKTFFDHLQLEKQKDAIEISEDVQAGALDTDVGSIFTGRQVDTKARLISKPEPVYTKKARKKGVTGTVVLKCIFSGNGTITNIRLIETLPYGLTERAIAAARKIRFIPATKDGRNVSMWMQLEYNFNLY